MSEAINLNDRNFDVGDVTIFNEGKAGRVNDVTLRVEKKDSSDTSRSPDWKVFYTDPAGGEVNDGYYYLDQKHEKFKTHLKYQGAALKHLLHAVFGEKMQIPEFKTAKEMLDKCMTELSKTPEDKKFRVGVSYGTGTRPSAYLRVKPYPVFIEPMSVPEAESRIVFTGDYLMQRPVADAEEDALEAFTTDNVKENPKEDTTDMSGFDTSTTTSESQREEDDLPF